MFIYFLSAFIQNDCLSQVQRLIFETFENFTDTDPQWGERWHMGAGGYFVGEHNKSERQIVSICVSRPNPEVELNQMESADTAL